MKLKDIFKELEPFDEITVDHDLTYIITEKQENYILVRNADTGTKGMFDINFKMNIDKYQKASELYL